MVERSDLDRALDEVAAANAVDSQRVRNLEAAVLRLCDALEEVAHVRSPLALASANDVRRLVRGGKR